MSAAIFVSSKVFESLKTEADRCPDKCLNIVQRKYSSSRFRCASTSFGPPDAIVFLDKTVKVASSSHDGISQNKKLATQPKTTIKLPSTLSSRHYSSKINDEPKCFIQSGNLDKKHGDETKHVMSNPVVQPTFGVFLMRSKVNG